jgi:hypothetical protein
MKQRYSLAAIILRAKVSGKAANDNYKQTAKSVNTLESGNVLKEGEYDSKIKGLPYWKVVLIIACGLALGYFLGRLAF